MVNVRSVAETMGTIFNPIHQIDMATKSIAPLMKCIIGLEVENDLRP
jgi:hypothetical protein